MPTETFTSDTDWSVPDSVSTVEVTLLGGRGGFAGGERGSGGEVTGTLDVSGVSTLYLRFTQGGNGGYASVEGTFGDTFTANAGDGGDAPDIRIGGAALSDRAVVAGAGAGASDYDSNDVRNDETTASGDGGGLQGEDGENASFFSPGQGGTQNSGVSSGAGGNGTQRTDSPEVGATGGGGAGYYGGTAGDMPNGPDFASGSGGGSSYVGGLTTVDTNAQGVHSGAAEIQISYTPVPELDPIADNGDGTVDLTWSPIDVVEYNVYRAETSGADASDYTQIATVTDETFTDDIGQGVERHYRVAGVDSGGSEGPLSSEESILTELPIPSAFEVVDVRNSEVDTGWTATHLNGETRVEARPTGETEWGDAAPGGAETTVANDVESATLTGLRNGEEYEARAVAVAEDAESEGTTEQATTDLPDDDQPALGNGVEDEVAVDRETAVSNYGDVRIQIRETGQSTWDLSATGFGEFLGAFDTLSMEFVDREDGEEYEVRSRTETEHVTGAWTDPVAIVAQFPGAASLSVSVVSPTETELTWTDRADNEVGQLVIRERRVGGAWWPEETLEDVGPNTESYTDTTVQPDTEYRYRIRPFTEHTSADSNLETVTTDRLDGIRDTRVPVSDYYVEIDAPSGDTLTPTVLEGVDYPAATNQSPDIEIPVPVADRWTRDALKGQPMRVWEDGVKLPIDTFEGVSTGPERFALLGSGGRQLDTYVESVQFDEKEHHLALQELLADTDYTIDVADPAATVRSDVEIVTVTIAGNTEAFVIPDTLPVSATLDGLRLDQTAWVGVQDLGGTILTTTNGDWAANEATELSSIGDTASITFSPAYAPPADTIEAAFSYSVVGESPGYEVRIDGDVIGSATAGALTESADQFDMEWRTTGATASLDTSIHTLEIEVTEDASGDLYVDSLSALDSRYADDTALVPASNGTIPEPGPYNAVTVSTQEYTTVEQVVGGRVELDIDDTSGAQAVAVSNGEDTLSASNTDVVDGTFASNGQTYQVELTLDGYGSQPESPTQRPDPQTVTSLEGFADLDDTPILLDRQFRGDLSDIVWEIADDADFLGEVRADPDARDSARDGLRVEIAPAGQRVQEVGRPLVDYDGTETIEKAYDRVVVFGGSESVEGETFIANDVDALQGLNNEWIKIDSERVTDGSGTVFSRGSDYRIDWAQGAIELVSGTSMTPGDSYTIDYDWRYRGVSTRPDAPAEPRTLEEAVPSVTSQREADQVALAIRKDVQDARLGATLTVTRSEPAESLIAALSHPEVPWEGPHDIRERSVVDDGAAVEYRIASRESAGEIVDGLRERFDSLADEV